MSASPSPSPSSSLPLMSSLPRISAADLQSLADYGFVVVENFLPQDLQEALRDDVAALRANQRFQVAKIGHDGMIQDETTPFRDIRVSETCFLNKNQQKENENEEGKDDSAAAIPLPAGRQQLFRLLSHLKSDLGIPLLKYGQYTKDVAELDKDLDELMYVYYPKGGYYRRHVDADKESVSSIRQYSFLLYLNKEWEPAHGGQLRLHRDSGGDTLPPGELPNYMDVPPQGGTLVVFRSDLVPHEVLDTHQERLAIVGWFLSSSSANNATTNDKENATPNTNTTISFTTNAPIHPETLRDLRELRTQSPKLKAKLEPSESQNSHQQHQMSGLLGDDFYFPSIETVPHVQQQEKKGQEEPVEYDDTDPNYWKAIATFTVQGRISTLSLAGQRLRKVDPELLQSLIRHATTLDLGNSDLSVDALVSLLVQVRSRSSIRNLYLPGYGLRDEGVNKLLAIPSLKQLETLDLRYNDVGAGGAAALTNFLEKAKTCHTLHLEGNLLQDEGAAALKCGPYLRELYLGQNRIGPVGAKALATNLFRLKKLYLEGNMIGSEGALAFVEVLESMPEKILEKLYVDNNGIAKNEAIRLGQALNSATVIGSGAFFQE